ncbi:MAG: hypothetical protein WKG07_19590 [Hymenobacter sp.]
MKHSLCTTALVGLGLLAAAPHSQAQTADRKFGISGYVSTLQYRGDLGSNFWDLRNASYGGGLTLTRYISKGWISTCRVTRRCCATPPMAAPSRARTRRRLTTSASRPT